MSRRALFVTLALIVTAACGAGDPGPSAVPAPRAADAPATASPEPSPLPTPSLDPRLVTHTERRFPSGQHATFTLEKATYTKGEKVRASVRLENTSSYPITVYEWPDGKCFVQFEVGREKVSPSTPITSDYVPWYGRELCPRDPARRRGFDRDKSHWFVRFKPGASHTTRFEWDQRRTEDCAGQDCTELTPRRGSQAPAGRYFVSVTFRGRLCFGLSAFNPTSKDEEKDCIEGGVGAFGRLNIGPPFNCQIARADALCEQRLPFWIDADPWTTP